MTERFETDRSNEEHDEAGRPLPDAWIRAMKEALSEERSPPGPTPRDAMWRVIESRIGEEVAVGITSHPCTPSDARADPRSRRAAGPWAWGLAASVVLLAGIVIGRGSVPSAAPPAATTREPAGVDGSIVRDVAARHLTSSETLLSFVGVDIARGDVDGELAARGRRLLADTRMLLRVAPAGQVELRSLLTDLELVLAQLALLEDADFDEARRAEEVELLGAGLRRSDLLTRIQAALPRLDARRRPMSSTD
jgi:hypothetical protein